MAEHGVRRAALYELARLAVGARGTASHDAALTALRAGVADLHHRALATLGSELAGSVIDPWGPREQLQRVVSEEVAARRGEPVEPLPIDKPGCLPVPCPTLS